MSSESMESTESSGFDWYSIWLAIRIIGLYAVFLAISIFSTCTRINCTPTAIHLLDRASQLMARMNLYCDWTDGQDVPQGNKILFVMNHTNFIDNVFAIMISRKYGFQPESIRSVSYVSPIERYAFDRIGCIVVPIRNQSYLNERIQMIRESPRIALIHFPEGTFFQKNESYSHILPPRIGFNRHIEKTDLFDKIVDITIVYHNGVKRLTHQNSWIWDLFRKNTKIWIQIQTNDFPQNINKIFKKKEEMIDQYMESKKLSY